MADMSARNTQSYEMYMAGYTFSVLNNVFLNHWGLQKRETRPHWRQMQHFLNNRLFKGFAKELTARYNKWGAIKIFSAQHDAEFCNFEKHFPESILKLRTAFLEIDKLLSDKLTGKVCFCIKKF